MKEKWTKLEKEGPVKRCSQESQLKCKPSQVGIVSMETDVQIKTTKECVVAPSVPEKANFNMRNSLKKIKKIYSQKSFGTKQQIFEHTGY